VKVTGTVPSNGVHGVTIPGIGRSVIDALCAR
jgi:hypothetical protein